MVAERRKPSLNALKKEVGNDLLSIPSNSGIGIALAW
jgi:hypothetical protein